MPESTGAGERARAIELRVGGATARAVHMGGFGAEDHRRFD